MCSNMEPNPTLDITDTTLVFIKEKARLEQQERAERKVQLRQDKLSILVEAGKVTTPCGFPVDLFTCHSTDVVERSRVWTTEQRKGFVEELASCKCCDRHQKRRPTTLELLQEYPISNIKQDGGCGCHCRQISRGICREEDPDTYPRSNQPEFVLPTIYQNNPHICDLTKSATQDTVEETVG